MLRTGVTVLAFVLLLAACTPANPEPGTGASGVVLIGPQCPVENPSSPCPDLPFHGEVQATASDGTLRSTTTDERGRFSLDLEPGTYQLVAWTGDGGGPPTARPLTIEVHAGSYTQVTLEIDTGIR